ncbi:MAG TPA: hypothetical protein VLB27_01575, partial [candidate division Zixibacteria bacterium]|nr:hypothetical protein [candidate division Zixibacteria bacterium]
MSGIQQTGRATVRGYLVILPLARDTADLGDRAREISTACDIDLYTTRQKLVGAAPDILCNDGD